MQALFSQLHSPQESILGSILGSGHSYFLGVGSLKVGGPHPALSEGVGPQAANNTIIIKYRINK